MKVIRPLQEETRSPIIFLAGPIQSAPDWHTKAIKNFKTITNSIITLANSFTVACPKISDITEFPENWSWYKQVEWESQYLQRASKNGVIMFWLAKPISEKLEETRCYAQTTRFELAEWFGKQCYDKNIKIVVGIEPGFYGERYIRKRLYGKIQICDTLMQTCLECIRLICA